MNQLPRFLAGASLSLLALTLCGCPPPVRICTGCTYKTATFSAVPTTNIESSTIKTSVKHIGACPQSGFASNCTESLAYETTCALGSSSIVTLPMLIDAASSNPNRGAKLTVKLVGNPNPVVLTGTVQTGSGSSVLPSTPCPPPSIDPYVTLPNVN